jgi:hypothetical protein
MDGVGQFSANKFLPGTAIKPQTFKYPLTPAQVNEQPSGEVKDSTLSPEDLKKARLKSLNDAQSKALKMKRFKPRNGNTYCNEGVKYTLDKAGVPVKEAGIAHEKGFAYTANTMSKNMAESAKKQDGYWLEVEAKRGQELANQGIPVVGSQINKGHGHVVTLKPGYEASDNPMVNNIGVDTKVKRADHAFNDDNPVHYYAPRNEANSIK